MKVHTALILLISVLFSTVSFAQLQLGIGFIGGFPSGEFDKESNFGAGVYIEGKVGLKDKIYGGLGVSAIYFGGDNSGGTGSIDPTVMIPILITGDFNFWDTKWTPYIGFGVGPYLIDSEFSNKTKIGFNPRVGVYLGSLNLGVGYHMVNDFNFFSFQIGYLKR